MGKVILNHDLHFLAWQTVKILSIYNWFSLNLLVKETKLALKTPRAVLERPAN